MPVPSRRAGAERGPPRVRAAPVPRQQRAVGNVTVMSPVPDVGHDGHAPHRKLSALAVVALVLALVSAACLVIVLLAAAFGRVLWSGFTLFPAVFFPVAFMLMCIELARSALRRRRGA